MPSPFPGVDPYLENPELWPDVHNGLIAALRDELSPRLRPSYYVALEERTYLEEPGELVLVGRPDLTVIDRDRLGAGRASKESLTPTLVEVELPVGAQVRETFLEVRLIGVSILMGVCRADRIVAEVVDGAHRCWLAGYG